MSPRQYNTALRFSLGCNCTLSLPLVSVLRGTNKFLNQRQGLILKVVKSQQRLSLMGLGGNIGTREWGLFALEITHYLPPRSPPSPIRKYNALYTQNSCQIKPAPEKIYFLKKIFDISKIAAHMASSNGYNGNRSRTVSSLDLRNRRSWHSSPRLPGCPALQGTRRRSPGVPGSGASTRSPP